MLPETRHVRYRCPLTATALSAATAMPPAPACTAFDEDAVAQVLCGIQSAANLVSAECGAGVVCCRIVCCVSLFVSVKFCPELVPQQA